MTGAARGRAALWVAFVLVHLWLTVLGVLVVPAEAFHDVDLYRWWMYLALERGQWPVLDDAWVYPVGALVPMLLPAVGTTVSTVGYALGWCLLVTALDAVAVVVLVRRAATTAGAWWWLAFLALLGPVAVGRLDAIVAPLMVVALVLALRSPPAMAIATALLTAGAWVKVAPGALLLPLVAASRRPVRDVVAPAAAVCAVVVCTVAAGGGLSRLTGFLTTQQGRGLQVESVTATPWVLATLSRDDVRITLNEALTTYEVTGPGTTTAAAALDVVLALAVAALAAVLLLARRRGTAQAALLPAALTLLTVLIVTNKVGSPQFLAWLAAPFAVLLTAGVDRGGRPRWVVGAAVLALVAAGLTQAVFPWWYMDLLAGDALPALTLAARNVLLVAVLTVAAVGLAHAVRGAPVGRSER
ncbi:glycosyltransferase 87 family protein [Cellulomonas sp. KRMCY2]|uniref:glycosyltransferase 87 family protein n=1 Tax=Cellulomonas sp. KRMCY2 TaxID=1304865 RepID=UPI00045EB7B3|nr:glycosyltransferase 87 family protein [Cellulomonas sp. KRMCY2]